MINLLTPNVCTKVGTGINNCIHTPVVKNFIAKGLNDNDKAAFAAKMFVFSLISKDAVNCAIYTTQSYNNKKIPAEKRPFVAFNDLFNGILNVGGQIAAFSVVDKLVTPKIFANHYSGVVKNAKNGGEEVLVGDVDKAKLYKDNLVEVIKGVVDPKCITTKNKKLVNKIKSEVGDLSKYSKEELLQIAEKASKDFVKVFQKGVEGSKFGSIEKGFGIVVAALATNALIKRTITPLISTPLAGYFSDKVAEKNKKAGNKSATVHLDPIEVSGKYYSKDWDSFTSVKNSKV